MFKTKSFFITGTDTGVGKTLITGLLADYFLKQGLKVITQKWIQTGSNKKESSDINQHLKLMGKTWRDFKDYQKYMVPYTFKYPASPHLAAKLEKKNIFAEKIIRSFNYLKEHFDLVLVEGVGGALVPYNQKNLVIDIVKKLDIPVIIVIKNQLGAINHSLLTIEALKTRKLKIAGLVFNHFDKEDLIAKDNIRIIEKIFTR